MRKYIIITLLCFGLQASAQQYMYWFDDDIGAAMRGTMAADRIHIDADVSGLSYGLHTLNYALLGEDNSITSVRFAAFNKGMKAKKYLYWFDNDTESAVSNDASAGLVHLDADVSALQPGFHILNFAVLGEDDAVTSMRFSSFVKAVGLSANKLRIVYSFDKGASSVSDAQAMGDGLYGFSLDVSALEEGEHTISFMLTDGKYSLYTGEAQFVKAEMSGINVIMSSPNSNGKTYNLNGIRINPTSKNIYIVNGKKVMLK
jgi:hypothetical protein